MLEKDPGTVVNFHYRQVLGGLVLKLELALLYIDTEYHSQFPSPQAI